MKVRVAVEFTFDKLPDDAARALARQLVESRGLSVESVSVVTERGRTKVWMPKAGKPGSVVHHAGRAYQVWSDALNAHSVWLVPMDRREGDAPVYLSHRGGRPEPYHGNGKACESTWSYGPGLERIETPCQHPSHARQESAA